jgi:hypothetical protein
MDEQQAREDIKLIRDMLERTRRATAESGTLFIFWGVWLILALAGHYGMVLLHRYGLIWVDWAFFGFAGWIITAVYHYRRGRRVRTRTYAERAAAFVSFGCSIGFLLAAFVLPLFKVYSYDAISAVISLLSGVMLFALGGIYQWPILWAAGILWWLGAATMGFIPGEWRGLALIPLMILGYIVPGLIFRSRFLKNGGDKAAA